MSRVNFYVLPDAGEAARQRFACRLAEKAYSLENSVHIRVADRNAAEVIDDLLWTFRDGSFVPHEQIADAGSAPASPITIGFSDTALRPCDLLINLGDDIPAAAGSFARVAEIVTSDETSLTTSRKRFAAYRDDGHALQTHKL